MIFKTLGELSQVGEAIKKISSFNDISSSYDDIAKATENLTLKNTMLALSTAKVSKEDAELILIAKGVKDEELKQSIATYNLGASQVVTTGSTFSLSSAFKGLTASIWANVKAIGSWLLLTPVGQFTAIATAIVAATVAVVAYKKAQEKALKETLERTEEAVRECKELNKEIESLEGSIAGLNKQIRELDPITKKEDVENLQAETKELEAQLSILKEKKRIESNDADQSAQDALTTTQDSKYATEATKYLTVVAGETMYVDGIKASDVTYQEELQHAMDYYDQQIALAESARDKLAEMSQENLDAITNGGSAKYTQEQLATQEGLIKSYESNAENARKHANELVDTISTQSEGLNGYTDASKQLLDSTEDSINSYNEWVKSIDASTDALQENADAQNDIKEISFSDIFSLEDSEGNVNDLGKVSDKIDDLQSSWSDLKETVDTFNKSGSITIDQLQEWLSSGDDYLRYLSVENGELELNENALKNVALARIEEMRAKALSGLYSQIEEIQNEEQALQFLESKLISVTDATNQYTDAQFRNLLMTKRAIMSDEDYAEFESTVMNMVKTMNTMFDNVSSQSFYSSEQFVPKDLLDAEIDHLEKQFENGSIKYRDYLDKRRALVEQYYADEKITAEEYYSYLEDLYKAQLDAMDMVVSAVQRKLDNQIDALEEQKELLEESYQLRIDSIQEEIDKLQEESDETKRLMDLEKARYDAERARNQKVKKVYNGDQFVYQADQEAIRDADADLKDKELDYYISNLEKEIESLEKELDDATKAIDDQIKSLNKLKDKWSDVTKAYDNAQEDLMASEFLGKDWEEKILTERGVNIENFKNTYVNAQHAMAQAAEDAAARIRQAELDKQNTVTKQYVSKGYKTQGEASSQIANYNGNGVVQDKTDKKWYVYKNVKFHDGLDSGFVGQKFTDAQRLDILRRAGNGKLRPDERMAILQDGELVMTEDQQVNIAKALMGANIKLNVASPTLPSVSTTQNVPNINLSIGDIQLYGVQDTDTLSKAIINELPNKVIQSIFRR